MWATVQVESGDGDETVTSSVSDNVSVRLNSVASIYAGEDSEGVTIWEGFPLCVVASPLDNGLGVLAGSQMILFDSTCSQHEATVNLGAYCDCLAWSGNGKFIALVDRSGKLHVFHVPSKLLLFSQELQVQLKDHDVPLFANLHFHECSRTDVSTLIVVTVSGAVFLLCNVDLNRLDEAIIQNNQASIRKIQESIVMKKSELLSTSEEPAYCSVTIMDETAGVSLVALADSVPSSIFVFSMQKDYSFQLLRRSQAHGNCKLIKCDVTKDHQYLVGLTEEKHLALFDFLTLVLLRTLKQHEVQNFCVLSYGLVTNGVANGTLSAPVVALLTSSNGFKPSKLLICRLPSLATELAVNVSTRATLPTVLSESSVLYFMESYGVSGDSQSPKLVVRSVWEQSPQKRFQHLLEHNEFEKADRLAMSHGLDRQLIQKCKVTHLLDKVCQRDSLDVPSIDAFIASVTKALSLIKDDDFVVSYCTDAPVPNIQLLSKLLLIAEKRLKTAQSGSHSSSQQHHVVQLEQVLSSIKKLTTYHQVSSAKFEYSVWRTFQARRVLDVITDYIQKGDFAVVSVIWRRHTGELMKQLTIDALHRILDSFPTELHLLSCLPFIEHEMLPLVTMVLPRCKVVLAAWIETVVEMLEVCDKKYWPDNGLQLIEVFLPYIDIPTRQSWQTLGQYADQICLSSVCSASLSDIDSVNSLHRLSRHLQELSYLLKTFSLQLTLSQMKQETANSIAFRLIDRAVVSGVVSPLMEKQALQYIKDKSLDQDDVLLNYIKSLFITGYVSFNASRMWEQKAVAALAYIRSAKVKNLAVTEIVRMASVPISAAIRDLVAEMLKSSTYVAGDELKQFWNVLEVKEVLNKNNVIGCSLFSTLSLKLAIRRILHTRSFMALQDALKIVSVLPTLSEFEVYVQYLYGLLMDGQVNESMTCLNTMDKKQACSVAMNVLSRLMAVIHYPLVRELNDAEHHQQVVQVAKVLLSFLMKADDSPSHWQERYQFATAIGSLQLEFESYMSRDDYENDIVCNKLLDQHVQAVFSNAMLQSADQRDCRETFSVPFSISRRACLLRIQSSELKQKLANKFLENQLYKLSLDSCRLLVEDIPYCSTATRTVLNVVQTLLANPSQKFDMSQLCATLKCCLISCQEDDIADVLETWKVADVIETLEKSSKKSEISSSQLLEGEFDDLEDFMFGSNFDGIETSADCSSAATTASKLCSCFWISHTQDIFPLEQTRLSSVSRRICKDGAATELSVVSMSSTAILAVSALETCGLFHQAFQAAFLVFGACTQYYLNNVTHGSNDKADSDEESDESESQQSAAVITAACARLTQLAKKVLDQMLSCVVFDHSESLGYLLCLPSAEVMKELSTHETLQTSALKRVPAIELDLSVIHGLANVAVQYAKSQACIKWCEFLQEHGVVDQSLVLSECSQQTILELLTKASANHPVISIRTIAHFCNDFDVDIQQAVQAAVAVLLERKDLNSEGLKLELLPAIELLNAGAVQLQLAISYDMICETDYDGISLLLSLLEELPAPTAAVSTIAKAKQLLNFVRCYSECSSQSVNQDSKKESTELLPFRRLMQNPWKVIAPRLLCDTFSSLQPIAKLLQVDSDRLYSRTIRNSVEKMLHDNKQPLGHQDFCNVSSLLLQIRNPRTALATGRWAAMQFETGPIKAVALEVCLKLARLWKDSCSETDKDEALKTTEKLDFYWRQIETRLLLRGARIPETVYDSFLYQPASLIIHLYEIPDTIKTEDVHDLADKIADIYTLNCNKIRLHLLEKWLGDAGKDKDDKHLVFRLVSLMKGIANPEALAHMASCKEVQGNPHLLAKHVVVLRTLYASTAVENFKQFMDQSVEELRDHVRDMLYCQDLLSIVQSPSAFKASSKLALVKNIWKSHANSGDGIKLLSGLCLDFGIGDVLLWREIFRKLLDYGMIDYLKSLLQTMTSHLSQSEQFILTDAWQSAVMMELDTDGVTLEASTQLLQFLQSSPYLDTDHLISTSRRLEEMDLTAEALSCLLMSPVLQSQANALVSRHKEAIVNRLQAHSYTQLPMIQQIQGLLCSDVEQ